MNETLIELMRDEGPSAMKRDPQGQSKAKQSNVSTVIFSEREQQLHSILCKCNYG